MSKEHDEFEEGNETRTTSSLNDSALYDSGEDTSHRTVETD